MWLTKGIADFRMPIADCRFESGAIQRPSLQSTIGNQQSAIDNRQSTIGNRQSAIG
jgi:hypothetical protein